MSHRSLPPWLWHLMMEAALDDDDVAFAKSTCQHILLDMCMSSTANVAVGAAVGQSSNKQLYGVVNNFFEEVISTFSMDTLHSHFRMSRTAMEDDFAFQLETEKVCLGGEW